MGHQLVDTNKPENPLAEALRKPLSAALQSAVADKTAPSFGSSGFDERVLPWKLPAVISDDMRSEADTASRVLWRALRPSRIADVELWLASLGSLTASRKDADDADAAIRAMAGVLDDVPVAVLTQDTLRKAAKRFKWWPSYAELGEFLDAEKSVLERRLKRLRAIVDAPKTTDAARLEHHENRSRDIASQERGLRAIGEIKRSLRSMAGML